MLKWTVTKRADTTLMVNANQPPSRRSLGNLHRPLRNRDGREKRRKSLGSTEMIRRISNHNKENSIILTPHPLTNRTNGTAYTPLDFALRDLSNLTPNTTPTTVLSTTPSRKRNLPLSPVEPSGQLKPQYASTLPTFDIEYSPCGLKTDTRPMIALRGLTVKDSYFENPCYFRDEVPPAAKRLKFSPETTPLSKRLSELRFSKMSFKRSEFLTNDNDNDSVLSSKALDDTELEKMIDAILESSRKVDFCSERKLSLRRKEISKSPTYKSADDPASDLNKFCDNFQLSPEKLLQAGEKTIIIEESDLVNEREVRTPDSIKIANTKNDLGEASCHLRRQRVVRRKHTNGKVKIFPKPNIRTSPNTPLKNQSFVKRNIDYLAAMETPQDVESNNGCVKIHDQQLSVSYESTPGIEANDLQGSSTPTGSSVTTRRCLLFTESPDSMEDSLDKRKSVASSITSRSSKSSTSGNCISGTLDLSIFMDNDKIQIHVIRCKDLCRQNGGSINAYVKVALLPTEPGVDNTFQRTAVQRNSSRPFFDHRFTFERSTNDLTKRIQLSIWHRDREFKRSEFLGCMSFPIRCISKDLTGSYKLQPQSALTTPIPPALVNEPEAMQISSGVDCMPEYTIGTLGLSDSFGIPLSKKGLCQRDADEHLFLRFLELDKFPCDYSHPSAKESGRTQFTITKNLVKTDNQSYGFSIVWTHPPRIEKVEHGLSAHCGGIQPGDFVVFVDKYNVVTMPEIDILNLIRSLGNSMSLEIYRPSNESMEGGCFQIRIPSNITICSSSESTINGITTRPLSMPCSTVNYSIENVKRIPQITFSKDIGQGVIV